MNYAATMMRSLQPIGLAWTVLLVACTAVAAQTTTERPLSPVRLPGIVYPEDTRAAPKLKPEKQTFQSTITPVTQVPEQKQPSQLIIAPVTPDPEPRNHTVAIEPTRPHHLMPQSIVNERELPVPAVTVPSEAEAVGPVKSVALSPVPDTETHQPRGGHSDRVWNHLSSWLSAGVCGAGLCFTPKARAREEVSGAGSGADLVTERASGRPY